MAVTTLSIRGKLNLACLFINGFALSSWYLAPTLISMVSPEGITGHGLGGWHHLYVAALVLGMVLFFGEMGIASALAGAVATCLLIATYYEVLSDGGWISLYGLVAPVFPLSAAAIGVGLFNIQRGLTDGVTPLTDPAALRRARLIGSASIAVVLIAVAFGFWTNSNMKKANDAIGLYNQGVEEFNQQRNKMFEDFQKRRSEMFGDFKTPPAPPLPK